MRPARKLACALLAVAVVTAAVYATGAFTSTTAERSANVNVAGDASAFLALEKSDGPNAAFASYGSNGALEVRMGGASTGGTGVNPDSTAAFDNVFTITNKGAQPVSVWITGGREAVAFMGPEGKSIETERNAIELQPGGEPLRVGLVIDARGIEPGADLLESVTIHTDADTEGAAVPDDDDDGGSGGNDNGGNGDGSEDGRGNPANAGGNGGGDGNGNDDEKGDESTEDGQRPSVVSNDEGGDGSSNSDADEGSTDRSNSDEDANCGDDKICQLRSDVDNVVGFLEEHPELVEALAPGMEIATWAYENREQALSFTLGALLGAVGMPEGEVPVPEAGSLPYLAGWMAASFASGVDIVADARDAIQAGLNLKPWETLLGFGAIIPGAGKVGDIAQISKYTADWLGVFDKAAELRRMVTSGLMSHLPGGAKRAILGETLPATVKRSSLGQDEWARMVNNGHDGQRINRLLDSGFDGDDIRRFTRNDVDLGQVERVRDQGVSAYDVRHYVDEGTDLGRVERLADDGIPAEDIRHYVDHGDDAYNTRIQGSMSVGGREIRVGDGMSLDQVETLTDQGFPADDVRYYVENGVSLKLVGTLARRTDASPKDIKRGIEAFGGGQTVAEGYLVYNDIREWCGLQSTNSSVCS